MEIMDFSRTIRIVRLGPKRVVVLAPYASESIVPCFQYSTRAGYAVQQRGIHQQRGPIDSSTMDLLVELSWWFGPVFSYDSPLLHSSLSL